MRENDVTFNRGAVRPMACLSEAWELIKKDYWLFFGITWVGMIIAQVAPFGILAGPMMCGIYLCLFTRMHGRTPEFGLLFKGFDYFLNSFIATLFMVIPAIVVIVPAYIGLFVTMMNTMPNQPRRGQGGFQQGPQAPPNMVPFFIAMGIFYAALFLLIFVLGFLFYFTYQLIVDRRLSGVEAVKVGIKASFANMGGIIGLMLLNFGVALLGYLACCVGIFFVIPLHVATNAIAYRQVFPEQNALADDRDDDDLDPVRPRGDSGRTDFQSPTRSDRIR